LENGDTGGLLTVISSNISLNFTQYALNWQHEWGAFVVTHLHGVFRRVW